MEALGAAGIGELAHEPAVRRLVVLRDRVATIKRLARATESLPQRGVGHWPVQQVPLLIPDGEAQVDHLDIVVRTHGALGIGREDPIDVTDALEVLLEGGHGVGHDARLNVRAAALGRGVQLGMRHSMQRHRCDFVARRLLLRRLHVSQRGSRVVFQRATYHRLIGLCAGLGVSAARCGEHRGRQHETY